MRIFVASWFFPPATSSEGIVTYKLLRNSKHEYDVCSSTSEQWGYKSTIKLNARNIRQLCVETDDIDTWVERAVEIFAKEHQENPYDAIMTRCMPPESIEVARKIKEAFPDVAWIASLADPMARSPYHLKSMVLENEDLREHEKNDFLCALETGCDNWKDHRSPDVRYLCELKEVEDYALNNSDVLIFPCDALSSFMMKGKVRSNVLTVHHSFDTGLYPAVEKKGQGPITVSFLGHTDKLRSLEPVVRALHFLKQNNPAALNNIRFRFVGHVPEDVRALVYNYYLHDIVSVESDVDYLTSLKIMRESDWLLHVDAYFETHEDTGGSIFFAGKIADYMGTDAPILSITGPNSPADLMTKKAGGISVPSTSVPKLAAVIAQIAEGYAPEVNRAYRDQFDARNVAIKYDEAIERALASKGYTPRTEWPNVPEPLVERKIVSICIPSYNVQAYLDRCLHSLILCQYASALEVIVVNDGSRDETIKIGNDFATHYPSIVKVIDKENGGHGSTINAALEIATGEYFRVIDGDDWVDSINFDKLISRLIEKDIHADVISSNYDQIYIVDGHLVPWMKMGAFEDYAEYDFAATDFTGEYFTMASTMFKTEILKAADFKLQEHTFYVDVEYLLFPIPYAKTVVFTPEYIYRYAVGNVNQSINPAAFTKRYDHHDRVIRRMLKHYNDHKGTMGAGQRNYMKSLFISRLIPSHFTLSIVWDTDRQRGCARAKDFDAFLKSVDPEIHKACGKRLRAVRVARKAGFNPNRFRKPDTIGEQDGRLAQSKAALVSKLRRSDFGHKLAKNDFMRKVYVKHFKQK